VSRSALANDRGPYRGRAQCCILRVEERFVSDARHLSPHVGGHLGQLVAKRRQRGEVAFFMRVLRKVVELIHSARREDVLPIIVPDDPLRVDEPLAEELCIGVSPFRWVGGPVQHRSQGAALTATKCLGSTEVEYRRSDVEEADLVVALLATSQTGCADDERDIVRVLSGDGSASR